MITSFLAAVKKHAPARARPYGRLVRLVPSWLETHHLTLMTLVRWAGIVASSVLARGDLRWLWGVSVMIALQW